MGTLKEKLQWFYNLKDSIITMMNNRQAKVGSSTTYTTSSTSLESMYNYYNDNCQRLKYIPILTDYVIYGCASYGVATSLWYQQTSGGAYTNSSLMTSNYSTNQIRTYLPSYLTRNSTGNYTGSLSNTAGYNYLFSMAMQEFTNYNMTLTGFYSNVSYLYSSGAFKVVTADDDSSNDGYFILGNIRMVDPTTLTDDQVNNIPICLAAKTFGGGSYHLNSTYENDYSISGVTSTSTFLTSSTQYSISFTAPSVYTKLFPVVIPICRDTNDTYALANVSIKYINSTGNHLTIVVAMSDEGPMVKGYFRVYLF